MADTLIDLRGQVQKNLSGKNPRTDMDSYINWALNRALEVAAQTHRWTDLQVSDSFTTTASVNEEALPASHHTTLGLMLQDGSRSRKLEWIPPRLLDQKVPLPSQVSEGRPHAYTIWAGNWVLFRIPDDEYTIAYKCDLWPTALTADDDTPDIDHIDLYLVEFATQHCFRIMQEFESADTWEKRAAFHLQRALVGDGWQPDYQPDPAQTVMSTPIDKVASPDVRTMP